MRRRSGRLRSAGRAIATVAGISLLGVVLSGASVHPSEQSRPRNAGFDRQPGAGSRPSADAADTTCDRHRHLVGAGRPSVLRRSC